MSSEQTFATRALNRITFGATPDDIAKVVAGGWPAWVNDQLNPQVGDDPVLARRLAEQMMPIRYVGQARTETTEGWPEVNEIRPLRYLNASVATLWGIARRVQVSVAANELVRIGQELKAATWIRNTHAVYQVREFMVDFWHNHFNIGRQADSYAAAALPDFDQNVVRPRALGNFRDLLGAVAASPAMLRYLNNADSAAAHPNENFAREVLELHTMGRGAYLGIDAPADHAARGFTDQDVIALAHALSGWTVEQGQPGAHGDLPFTGRFVFNPVQHSAAAVGAFMGTDLTALHGLDQANRALDIAAAHPATAAFICGKLCRRIFGDAPPLAVLERAKAAWQEHSAAPDQIKRVVAAILLDGDEIGAAPSKLRRPYERIIAFLRTTGMDVNATEIAYTTTAPLGDGVFVWPTPDGRPDTDAQWISIPVNFFVWNILLLLPFTPGFRATLAVETPQAAKASAETVVGYWAERLTGGTLSAAGMAALVNDANAPDGLMHAIKHGGITDTEFALRRLVSLIGAAPEFAVR
jgi:uncharacterized protein (DUF1800 family)